MSVNVAAAIIRKDDKILICRRGEGGSCAFLWEFPGGKSEPGETPEQCLVRECREELDIGINTFGIFAETAFKYPEREIHFTFLNAKIVSGDIHMDVHKDIKWVNPKDFAQYKFCPADVKITERLININEIKPGRYRHFKGNEYRVITVARHSETEELMVVYQALYGERGIWVRPASMWNEVIERDGKTLKRFEYIGD